MPWYGFTGSRVCEVSIAAHSTVSEDQPTQSVDPQASLRTELVGQLAAAELALEAAIAELGRGSAASPALAESRSQLGSLIDLRRQIGAASGRQLGNLRAEIVATAASATALAQQAISGGAASSSSLDPAERARAARAAIESVGRDLFGKRVLDPYLQFGSGEEEEAYRKRERERQEAMQKALELHTPEGDRKAAEIVHDQLKDAKAHGADRAPEFADLWNKSETARQTLSEKPPAQAVADATPLPPPSNDVSGIAATLRAAGLSAPAAGSGDGGHGLNFDKLALASQKVEGRG